MAQEDEVGRGMCVRRVKWEGSVPIPGRKWYSYLNLVDFNDKHVGKYTIHANLVDS